ncbi:MAG TPA: Lrp/AsnC family transcriptional regulator, partial [Rhizobiales bacterium]|nr:Lrp/AsnC family transcriptional regulator [Hyphomicrobiales bacterium]
MLDKTDRAIIEATQTGLPLTPAPYAQIANQLRLRESEVIGRMQKMLASGIIRRMGAVPNHYTLGWKANGMSCWDIPDEDVSKMGKIVGALDFVSHCYRRPRHLPLWSYNLFAMVHGKTRDEVENKVAR